MGRTFRPERDNGFLFWEMEYENKKQRREWIRRFSRRKQKGDTDEWEYGETVDGPTGRGTKGGRDTRTRDGRRV